MGICTWKVRQFSSFHIHHRMSSYHEKDCPVEDGECHLLPMGIVPMIYRQSPITTIPFNYLGCFAERDNALGSVHMSVHLLLLLVRSLSQCIRADNL